MLISANVRRMTHNRLFVLRAILAGGALVDAAKISEMVGRSRDAVFRDLHDLRDLGWIAEAPETIPAKRGRTGRGPDRRTYTVTQTGMVARAEFHFAAFGSPYPE